MNQMKNGLYHEENLKEFMEEYKKECDKHKEYFKKISKDISIIKNTSSDFFINNFITKYVGYDNLCEKGKIEFNERQSLINKNMEIVLSEDFPNETNNIKKLFQKDFKKLLSTHYDERHYLLATVIELTVSLSIFLEILYKYYKKIDVLPLQYYFLNNFSYRILVNKKHISKNIKKYDKDYKCFLENFFFSKSNLEIINDLNLLNHYKEDDLLSLFSLHNNFIGYLIKFNKKDVLNRLVTILKIDNYNRYYFDSRDLYVTKTLKWMFKKDLITKEELQNNIQKDFRYLNLKNLKILYPLIWMLKNNLISDEKIKNILEKEILIRSNNFLNHESNDFPNSEDNLICKKIKKLLFEFENQNWDKQKKIILTNETMKSFLYDGRYYTNSRYNENISKDIQALAENKNINYCLEENIDNIEYFLFLILKKADIKNEQLKFDEKYVIEQQFIEMILKNIERIIKFDFFFEYIIRNKNLFSNVNNRLKIINFD